MIATAIGDSSIYTFGGITTMLVTAVVALWRDNNSKDKTIKSQAEKMTEVATGLSHTMAAIGGSIKDLPETVKDKVVPPIVEEIKELEIIIRDRNNGRV